MAVTGAVADDIVLSVNIGPSEGQVDLRWTGTGPIFEVYRALGPAAVIDPSDRIGVTASLEWVDSPPDAPIVYYLVIPALSPVCGDGVRETGEQCDDGNLTDLDGCSAGCRFEQAQRAVYFNMQFGTDAVCPANALGAAIVGSVARSSIQSSLDASVADGSLSFILAALGATDLTGTNDPAFQIGFLAGPPETRGGTLPYSGTSDLDWWYIIDPTTIDAGRQPIYALPASITSRLLAAGPGTGAIPQLFGAGGALQRYASARLQITVGSSSAPLASAAGDPPGHLSSENLDPALVAYETCGARDATGSGRLCGNMVAASLARSPIAPTLQQNCSQAYTLSNSMLDVLIGGCTVLFIPQIAATQPDTSDPTVPLAGAGPPYRLSANAQRVVTTCRDRNGVVVDLAACLDSAAYSSFFRIATDRVIPR